MTCTVIYLGLTHFNEKIWELGCWASERSPNTPIPDQFRMNCVKPNTIKWMRRTMPLKITQSIELFKQAQGLLPGGVDSPVRAFRAVGGQPLFIEQGSGAYLYDVDGNRYIDYVLSWGPLILGHAHPQVVQAIQAAAEKGTSFGAPSPLEIELARLVREFMPGLEDAALRQLRHRSNDERPAAGTRLHRAR
jgi:hypothetical protein